jgi:long-subunit fatty acid transport protein
MKISLLRNVFVLIIFLPFGTQAQTEYGETFVSRLYVGGNFGLGFGSLTSIDVSPMIGYNINRHFSGGVGATYMYYSYRNYTGESERASFYGGRIFGRIVPLPDMFPNIFLHGEFESINNERWVKNDLGAYEFKRTWTPAVPIGAGFKQMAGENSFFSITVLWNILDDGTQASSIYGGPLLYRVGFIFGLN